MQKNGLKYVQFLVIIMVVVAISTTLLNSQLDSLKTANADENLLKTDIGGQKKVNIQETATPQAPPPTTKSIEELTKEAENFLQQGDVESAIDSYTSCYNRVSGPQKIYIAIKLAQSYYSINKFGEAIHYYTEAKNLNPSSEELYKINQNLGNAYIQIKAYNEAEPILEENYATSQTLNDFIKLADTYIALNQKEKLEIALKKHLSLYSFDERDLKQYSNWIEEQNLKNVNKPEVKRTEIPPEERTEENKIIQPDDDEEE